MQITIAETILAQLGGSRRLALMIGANTFTASPDALSFRFKARGLRGIKAVRVVLEPSDTYRVEFWTLRGKKVTETSDVYCDSLRTAIETETGLYLSL